MGVLRDELLWQEQIVIVSLGKTGINTRVATNRIKLGALPT
jgi:hypothetical protein